MELEIRDISFAEIKRSVYHQIEKAYEQRVSRRKEYTHIIVFSKRYLPYSNQFFPSREKATVSSTKAGSSNLIILAMIPMEQDTEEQYKFFFIFMAI